jgi:hypothetical protein
VLRGWLQSGREDYDEEGIAASVSYIVRRPGRMCQEIFLLIILVFYQMSKRLSGGRLGGG